MENTVVFGTHFHHKLPGPATRIQKCPAHIRPSTPHLKHHNGYTKQFKALIEEDISSVVLAQKALFVSSGFESGPDILANSDIFKRNIERQQHNSTPACDILPKGK